MILLGLMASVGLAGASARANFINFDPDGANNPNGTGSLPAATISGFDQAVGNALAVGGNAAIANFVGGDPRRGISSNSRCDNTGYAGYA